MIDQADFAGIDAYVKRHALNDASMAQQRRAKRYNVNAGRKNEDGGEGVVGNGIDGKGKGGGKDGDDEEGDEDGETELQKAERMLQDEEDEGEEDYDPSAGESEGEGEDSEEEEGEGDGYRDDAEEDEELE